MPRTHRVKKKRYTAVLGSVAGVLNYAYAYYDLLNEGAEAATRSWQVAPSASVLSL